MHNMEKTYKIKEGFMLRQIGDNYIVVAVGKASKFNGMISLNESGASLWKLVLQYHSLDELVEKMMEIYNIDAETARDDINNFLKVLEDNGILEE